MFDKIRTINGLNMTDAELSSELVRCLPTDEEGALFWV